jgi:hypothetical protein
MKRITVGIGFGIILLFILALAWLLTVKLQGQAPMVHIDLSPPAIGASKSVKIDLSDEKSGLREAKVWLVSGDKQVALFEKQYPCQGWFGAGKVKDDHIELTIEPKKMGFSDGSAVLKVMVRDLSWHRWWHGRLTQIEQAVTIDTKAPGIEVLSRVLNINQGGAGVVVYRLSEPCQKTGVQVGDHFFPGHSGAFKDASIYLAMVAVDYTQGSDTQMDVQAMDLAGNSARAGFYHHILKKNFRHDTIEISDGFLNATMPQFNVNPPANATNALLDKFLMVNGAMRKANADTIFQVTSHSEAKMFWKGPFLRLPGSATRAGFADHRDYRYRGRVIDHQVHLGIDLASLAHSPVPAANAGKVAFTGDLGIYGNAVIIDHGFGLFSLYGHMSVIDVTRGQMVARGDIIGKTGQTGMAGGDHLHFSMIVDNVFVNPIEWWDDTWIKNNITAKLEGL